MNENEDVYPDLAVKMDKELLVKMDEKLKVALMVAAALSDTDMAKIVRRGIRRELADLAEQYPSLKEQMQTLLHQQSVTPSLQGA